MSQTWYAENGDCLASAVTWKTYPGWGDPLTWPPTEGDTLDRYGHNITIDHDAPAVTLTDSASQGGNWIFSEGTYAQAFTVSGTGLYCSGPVTFAGSINVPSGSTLDTGSNTVIVSGTMAVDGGLSGTVKAAGSGVVSVAGSSGTVAVGAAANPAARWPAESNVKNTETAWGPNGNDYAGQLNLTALTKSNLREGVTAGGITGEFTHTADYVAKSTLAARGDVRKNVDRGDGQTGLLDVDNATEDNIRDGVQIAGVTGKFTHTADYVAISGLPPVERVATGTDRGDGTLGEMPEGGGSGTSVFLIGLGYD